MARINLVIHKPKRRGSRTAFKALDLVGKRFGRLVVVRNLGLSQYYRTVVECKCDCGKKYVCEAYRLVFVPKKRKRWGRKTAQQSCGCIRKERGEKHWNYVYGARSTRRREFNSYTSMKQRCLNPYSNNYADYGGKGITICKRWLEPMPMGFLNFLEDMGPRPRWMTLDRKNPEKGYEPRNCRWATKEVQIANRTNSVEDVNELELVAGVDYY